MKIKTDIADLHVADGGNSETALVFLHYWGGSGHTWDEVVAALRDDHRCIAPDLPGWGQSSPSRGRYRIADLATAVEQVIEALELDRVVLVGHSMGGKIAQYLAGQRPGWLQGLVLVAPSPALPMNLPASQRQAMRTAYDSRESVEATLDGVLTATPLENATRGQAIADSLAGHPDAKAAWPGYAMHEDISKLTSRIDVPTMLLTGEHDPVDSPAVLARHLVPYLPDPEIHQLPGAGHLLPLEAPADVAAHMARYLDLKVHSMTDIVTDPTAFPHAFDAALNSGSLDRVAALYDTEAVLRVQSGEIHSGIAAVRAEMQQLISTNAKITNTLRHTLLHEDTALIIVDYVLELTLSDGKPISLTGTATNVIRQHPQKGWRMIIANPQGVA